MTEPQVAEYGSWKSSVTSELIASGAIRIDSQIVIDGQDIYGSEGRPEEAGRSVIVRHSPGKTARDITPEGFNARTRVHEYGGGAFLVDNGTVYFSNFADQRIYKQSPGTPPLPVTPEGALRFADGIIDHTRHRIICVSEDHGDDANPVNRIAGVDLDGKRIVNLISRNDFYSSPRLSPDGKRLTWLTWNHPHMPWDYTELWLGNISPDGGVADPVKIAGGSQDSISQPRFAPDGTLYFISEKTGWWNLYRWDNGHAEAVCTMEAEFGAPQWVFGLSNYDFGPAGQIVCAYTRSGKSYLAAINPRTGTLKNIDIPYTSISTVKVTGNKAVLLAGSPTRPASIISVNVENGEMEVLRQSSDVRVDTAYFSVPLNIEFPTEDGLTAYAYYYRPQNRDFAAPPNTRPPLIIISHGGPTSAASSVFNLSIQYWTSRGFAVADVNYGGSSGYGREYRQRLNNRWGIVDVDDCVNCARYLVQNGDADPDRIAIRGGSAGGYTTLATLTFRKAFKAGASYYGVSDLEALEKYTHKFESRYLDTLIGPYPEKRDLFVERSPINHVDRLSCPVIFFQGNEDKIVPPAQAELMVDALRKKHVPVAYLLFNGEQHGFRQAANIKRALDAELYFYSRIFNFKPAGHIEPVEIENLE